jgi:hypothetical protein
LNQLEAVNSNSTIARSTTTTYPGNTIINLTANSSHTEVKMEVRPEDIPDGFSSADPTNNGGAGGGGDPKQAESQAKQEQRRSVLEQALTPEALARLGTIKVRS